MSRRTPSILALAFFVPGVLGLTVGATRWLDSNRPTWAYSYKLDGKGHGIISPFHNKVAPWCPCLLQPVHIKARRWHAPPAKFLPADQLCRMPVPDLTIPSWADEPDPMPEVLLADVPAGTVWELASPVVPDDPPPTVWHSPPSYWGGGGGMPRPPAVSVPEPPTWALMGIALGLLAWSRRT